ncbi:MAG: hypothetical protein II423_05645 [Erysipelotrichaceae bacterium]|nr:hypothetical protein [Erysipelotrichaceae bacterium]
MLTVQKTLYDNSSRYQDLLIPI